MANQQPVPDMTQAEPTDAQGISAFNLPPDLDNVKWEEASSIIWRPEVGETLTGILESYELFETSKYDKPVMRWIMQATDGIRYTMVGGEVFDSQLIEANVLNGDLLRITYRGKKNTPNGNVMNDWRIQYFKLVKE